MKPAVIRENFSPRLVTGVAGPAAGAFLEQLARARFAAQPGAPRVALALARSARHLEGLAADLAFFHRLAANDAEDWEILLYPEIAVVEGDENRAFEQECDRLAALAALAARRPDAAPGAPARAPEPRPLVLVTTLAAVLAPAPPPDALAVRARRLAPGGKMIFSELVAQLGGALGYANEAVCETPGQFAVRGGLIDVYPVNAAAPVRLDFFGDELESIRQFDPTTQLTTEAVPEVTLAPAPRELAGRAAPAGLLAHLPASAHWLIHEPARQAAEQPELFALPEKMAAPRPTLQTVLDRRAGAPAEDFWTGLAELDEDGGPFDEYAARRAADSEPMRLHRPLADVPALGSARLAGEQAAQRDFLRALARWQRDGLAVVIALRADGEAQRLREILAGDSELKNFSPQLVTGDLAAGFVARGGGDGARLDWPGARGTGVAVVAENEIFGRHRQRLAVFRPRRLPQRHRVDQMLDFAEIAEGDYLVHVAHGICRFGGLRKLDAKGRAEEVISLEFADGLELHLPLQESHLLSRYVGLAKITPKLGKIGGAGWSRARGGRARHARFRRGTAAAPGRARPAARFRLRARPALAAGIRGRLSARRDARPAPRHRRDQGRARAPAPHGPPVVRRRGFRQDRGRPARGVQGGAFGQAGRGARADDDSRAAALQHLPRAPRGVSGFRRAAQPLSHAEAAAAGSRATARGPARHRRGHAPPAQRRRAVQGPRAAHH